MSVRCYSADMIAGAFMVGPRGLGIAGANVPATGDQGPSYLFNDLTLPRDASVEVRGQILTPPASGTFFAYDDGSFTLQDAAAGTYTFTYRLFADGVDKGTATATIVIGAAPVVTTITGTGGVQVGGAATVNVVSVSPTVNVYTFVGSGGVKVGGTAGVWRVSPSVWTPVSQIPAAWTTVPKA